ncbi:hypothetical protein EDD15DRAFT_2192863 [Pisolithus albus]|nr:hypothetical protein EDD15DRAFT_2192863 [Pisolithus albus]
MSGELADQFVSPITSLLDGEPYVGIPGILDSSVPLILIPRDPGVQPPELMGGGRIPCPQQFTFTRVGDPENRTYEIRIDDRVTRIEGDSVVAVRDGPAQAWGINFRESENAFIIQRDMFRPATVWTAEGDQINIRINPSTSFPRPQLFRFSGLTDE